ITKVNMIVEMPMEVIDVGLEDFNAIDDDFPVFGHHTSLPDIRQFAHQARPAPCRADADIQHALRSDTVDELAAIRDMLPVGGCHVFQFTYTGFRLVALRSLRASLRCTGEAGAFWSTANKVAPCAGNSLLSR